MINTEILNSLRLKIEALQSSAHYEIFKLIKKNNIPFNENSNGIFINMSNMDETFITELQIILNGWKNKRNSFKKTRI